MTLQKSLNATVLFNEVADIFFFGNHFFWAAALKGTKSCRTQGYFHSSFLKKWMRCYRGLAEGLQEPKLRSKKVDVSPENANWKLERADLRLKAAGLMPQRSED